ncbi:hypothetical protein AHAS_Ahas03G0206300 [Arachis hypogaea]
MGFIRLSELFEDRHLWIPFHLDHHFWVRMRSTQRSESMHIIDDVSWRSAPETGYKLEFNARNRLQPGVQLQKQPRHVRSLSLSPSTHKVGPRRFWDWMTVTSFKLASVRRDDKCKRINGFYFDMIENQQLISRAVTEHLDHFH